MVNANDPVEAGLVASLARPGGNVTGLSQQLTREIRAKQLQLLKQALPKMSRVAVLQSAATTVGARTSSPERQRAVGHSLGGGGRLRVRELGTGLLTNGFPPGMRFRGPWGPLDWPPKGTGHQSALSLAIPPRRPSRFGARGFRPDAIGYPKPHRLKILASGSE